MFALVADIEKYPQFLPLCTGLTVRSRKERDGRTLLVADMSVGYKAIRETFTTQVFLKPDERIIDVKYIDGPFRYLENHWRFDPAADGGSDVHFFIDYEFKSRILGALMGSMFDRAFRMFSDAFEKRADKIYGVPGSLSAQRRQRHVQRRPHRSLANEGAAAILEQPPLGNRFAACHGEAEPHQPDRLFGRAAARSGNAGDGQRDAGARTGKRARRHLQRGLARHRAMGIERRAGNAEHLHLGFVGIGDEAAVDDIGRAGNVGERGGDHAAGAGFGGGEHDVLRSAGVEHGSGERVERLVARRHSFGQASGIDDARRGDRRDAFLAADEAELLVGRRLDRDAVRRNRQHLRPARRPSPRGAARSAAPRRSR